MRAHRVSLREDSGGRGDFPHAECVPGRSSSIGTYNCAAMSTAVMDTHAQTHAPTAGHMRAAFVLFCGRFTLRARLCVRRLPLIAQTFLIEPTLHIGILLVDRLIGGVSQHRRTCCV